MSKRHLAVLAGLVAVFTLAGVAAAHVFNANPGLTIRKLPTGATDPGDRVVVFGRILSQRSFCKAGRAVRLFRVRPGADPQIGRDITDAEGEYRFVRHPRSDRTVYTRIGLKFGSSYGHSHRCDPERSANRFINVTGG
jgi:hypothetical protein